MTDTDRIKPYVPKNFPSLEAGVPKYINDELRRISQTILQVRETLVALEARIEALEP